MVRTEQEIMDAIKQITKDNEHVLTGELSNIQINAPRALMQLSAESKLVVLNWVLGKKFKSRLIRRED